MSSDAPPATVPVTFRAFTSFNENPLVALKRERADAVVEDEGRLPRPNRSASPR
jgi:hypothetical protein